MEAAEIGQLIEDLEVRVERLRAVYDQYFMGIERLEPLTMRKEVDRRLWILRREQIRNTGMRFKLETTIQRYNTYQQYWARIVREIENGTYQRDLGRAAARFGGEVVTAMGRRRQRMFEKGLAKRAEREARRARLSEAPAAPTAAPTEEAETFEVPLEEVELLGGGLEKKQSSSAIRAAAPLELDMSFNDSDAPGPPREPATRVPGLTMTLPRGAPTAKHGSLVPPAPGKPVAAPLAPRPPAAPPPSLPNGLDRPDRAHAAPGARPAAAHSPPSSPTRGPGSDGDLSPARLRTIYGQYVEAKRRANESTAAITYEKVAANLRETAAQLRNKHQGRAIDFEVIMRNGKPVLKPVVRG